MRAPFRRVLVPTLSRQLNGVPERARALGRLSLHEPVGGERAVEEAPAGGEGVRARPALAAVL